MDVSGSAKIIRDKERIQRARLFLDLAFKDYVAARVLLNQSLVLQGAILASTTIEKCFKGVAALTGKVARGHFKNAHVAPIKEFDPKFLEKLNPSFLTMLELVYDLRYLDDPDKPKPGFTIKLERWPILAELDLTVISLLNKISFGQGDAKFTGMYEHMVEAKDARLWENNYLLANKKKEEFIARRDTVYCVRIDEGLGLIEAFYEVELASTEGNFLKPGLLPKE
jgi:hypothetical protein